MAFLKLSGIELPVAGPLDYGTTLLGEKRRTFNGVPRSSVRKKLFTYSGRTPLRTLADSLAYRALVDGEGHSWSFDSGLASSLGLLPSNNPGPATVTSGGKYGNCLSVPDGQYIEWTLAAPNRRTVMVWRYDGSPLTWHHYALRFTGFVPDTGWKDGVVASALERDDISDWLSWDGAPVVRLTHRLFATDLFDDLVALPYAVGDDWAAGVFAAGAPFGQLPYHRLTGTGLHREGTVLGNAGNGRSEEDGSASPVVYESFDFELMEAP